MARRPRYSIPVPDRHIGWTEEEHHGGSDGFIPSEPYLLTSAERWLQTVAGNRWRLRWLDYDLALAEVIFTVKKDAERMRSVWWPDAQWTM